MSWGTCYSGSNNIHFDFPPIMDDGRNYASWQPGGVINEQIRQKEGIQSNWQYRKFLVENADNIIKADQLEACNQCCACPARYGDDQKLSNSPYLYKSCVDSTAPFGYETSDLKNEYLSRRQLEARMIAPALTQDQYLKYQIPNAN